MTHNSIDFHNPDAFHRGVLWHLKSNPNQQTIKEAKAFFESFKFTIFIDPNDADEVAHQICLLTAINAASRIAVQSGSVQVIGVDQQKRNDNSGLTGTLEDAIKEVGGTCTRVHNVKDTLGIVIGNGKGSVDCKFLIRAVFEGWRGGIIPYSEQSPFVDTSPIPLGAIVAAGLAVYECFRFINQEGTAIGYKKAGISLWDLEEKDWLKPNKSEPKEINSISPIWFCGLGHLGQAYIWTLGHLPIPAHFKKSKQITIQDKDSVSEANLSTSMLTFESDIDTSKVTLCNDWLGNRGFKKVMMVEDLIRPESKIDFGHSHLVCGLDNPKARRQVALRDPVLMIDGGIGGNSDDFQSVEMTVLPSDIDIQKKWADIDVNFSSSMPKTLKEYRDKGDEATRCGIETLNGKAVGFPFVGVVTAGIIMSELLRRNMNGRLYQKASVDLRDIKCANLTKFT